MSARIGCITATAAAALALVAGAGASRPSAALVHQFDYDAKAPLDVKEVSARKETGDVLHDLSFASPQGDRVPAYLVEPTGNGPFAAVVIQPGSGGDRRNGLALARLLAQHGIASLLDDPPLARRRRGVVFDVAKDRAFSIETIIEARRNFDLLEARSEIDPHRLGFVGFSAGAYTGSTVAGVDRRVNAYVLQAAGASAKPLFDRGFFGKPPTGAAYAAYIRQAETPFEPVRYIGGAAPASLLFQAGRKDDVFGAASLASLYRAASQPKQIIWYETLAHANLPGNARVTADAVAWLTARLRGTP